MDKTNDTPRTNYHLVACGGTPVGWINPATGAYTPAARCEPPGQPVGSTRPLMVQDPGFWP